MQVVVRTGGARQAAGLVSHSRERGAAEDMHGHRARQVAGLPPAAVLEVERVERLQVIRVGLQAHLAQEFILQDAVIPDLHGDGLSQFLAIEDALHIVLWCRGPSLHS